MKQVNINGKSVPAIGQGTWHIGDDPKQHDREVEALAGVGAYHETYH